MRGIRMTTKAANALYRYFETLYNLNQSLIKLCGIDVIDNSSLYEKYIEDMKALFKHRLSLL